LLLTLDIGKMNNSHAFQEFYCKAKLSNRLKTDYGGAKKQYYRGHNRIYGLTAVPSLLRTGLQ